MEIYLNTPTREPLPAWMNQNAFDTVKTYYERVTGYAPTPLITLQALAGELGLGGIYIKDESKRFGLNAFKALGALYAVRQAIGRRLSVRTLVAATDGNHGRAVTWAAKREGLPCVIFMPKGTNPTHVEAIRRMGTAEIFITDQNYDETVHLALEYAERENGLLVQDTELKGYQATASDIALGYSVMPAEALAQMDALGADAPTHVLMQAGVGSMAGGVLGYLAHRFPENPPKFFVVETWEVPCIMESVRQGKTVVIRAIPHTSMFGLNCGEPNPQTLPILRSRADCFVRCHDEVTYEGMRRLARPLGKDPAIISGECGAVTLGALMRLMEDSAYAIERAKLGLDEHARVLLFSTEGDTDPAHYRKVVEEA
ncbi:MAG: diaminopropionate ammonia-lyase [Clostridia bacterium]